MNMAVLYIYIKLLKITVTNYTQSLVAVSISGVEGLPRSVPLEGGQVRFLDSRVGSSVVSGKRVVVDGGLTEGIPLVVALSERSKVGFLDSS